MNIILIVTRFVRFFHKTKATKQKNYNISIMKNAQINAYKVVNIRLRKHKSNRKKIFDKKLLTTQKIPLTKLKS